MFELNAKGGWIVPADTVIPDETVIPDYSELGYGCTLGYDCTLGNGCTLGNCCTLGNDCKLGYGCKLGENTSWLNTTVKSWLTLANVDGTGRQIKIVRGTDNQIKIEAGCFLGTLEEFIAKAKGENKLRYVSIIGAIAEHI